ncbi:branched-chain amino acid ABC transporter, membrane protein [Citrifermentans bemidjiense Bem]|uniref:Branched-chain amino acid ABC transporter, membrane protein n=1 Tax=Citrifermentans bemidjiense (strain ATCC BAA-1014 / DSM 16622 / JCM 12645 / Bem) TaxID=404380 RepID=B5EDK4_CITBB|nr:branched-chain amino acid ABC transporter permease [Citrifermentans bemidjiense]ACH39200.1 branched-chain amino acid ABC transporter, membrane protein [Citrifermentans bemidjiense Bem]
MELLNQVSQFVISGLATGAIYALIGLSFAIIFNSTGIINFAQGEFVMLGGVLTIFCINALQLPLLAAICAAVAGTTVIGLVFERLAIRPLKNATPLALIIITIGASILIRGVVMLLWGKDTKALPAFSGNDPISVAGATLLPQHLWIFGVTILVIVGCRLFFHHTISGKAMRACSFNPRAANLVGVSVGRMVLFSFVISAAVGSLAGVIIAPLTMTAYDVGVMLGLKGFCAAIMGGMGSGLGTVLGGLILGALESLGAGLISSGYKDAIAFCILLLILFIRPQGLFKKGETERV